MKPKQREEFMSNLAKLYSHLQKELGLKTTPKVILGTDQKNADKMLGKTGYYDPNKHSIHLFITDRHPKDILRSFSHEVVHHWQHEHKQLEKGNSGEEHDPQYAQNDAWMRQMEKQAYLLGNMMFRDWEDGKKAKDRKSGKTDA
jgi:Zn-dependent peptidase ImmA (M78 family)